MRRHWRRALHGRRPAGEQSAIWTAGAVIVLSRSNPSSMRATLRKVARSAPGIWRVSASSSATWREGRRSSASILRMAEIEQPTRSASWSCVRSNARRRWRIQLPNEKVSAMVVYHLPHGKLLRQRASVDNQYNAGRDPWQRFAARAPDPSLLSPSPPARRPSPSPSQRYRPGRRSPRAPLHGVRGCRRRRSLRARAR